MRICKQEIAMGVYGSGGPSIGGFEAISSEKEVVAQITPSVSPGAATTVAPISPGYSISTSGLTTNQFGDRVTTISTISVSVQSDTSSTSTSGGYFGGGYNGDGFAGLGHTGYGGNTSGDSGSEGGDE